MEPRVIDLVLRMAAERAQVANCSDRASGVGDQSVGGSRQQVVRHADNRWLLRVCEPVVEEPAEQVVTCGAGRCVSQVQCPLLQGCPLLRRRRACFRRALKLWAAVAGGGSTLLRSVSRFPVGVVVFGVASGCPGWWQSLSRGCPLSLPQ